jgi:hypothetical protein
MTAIQSTPSAAIRVVTESDLLARQNADGGWGYYRGSSWTEPTCYALLGLWAAGTRDSTALERGASWLRAKQNSDGGFAPKDGVAESTWVTTLALLTPEPVRQYFDSNRAAGWLLSSTGKESTLVHSH